MNIAASYNPPAKSWKDMKLRVGQKVRIRQWDDLTNEFGAPYGMHEPIRLHVDYKNANTYTLAMGRYLAGRIIEVTSVPNSRNQYTVACIESWYISWPMIEPV